MGYIMTLMVVIISLLRLICMVANHFWRRANASTLWRWLSCSKWMEILNSCASWLITYVAWCDRIYVKWRARPNTPFKYVEGKSFFLTFGKKMLTWEQELCFLMSVSQLQSSCNASRFLDQRVSICHGFCLGFSNLCHSKILKWILDICASRWVMVVMVFIIWEWFTLTRVGP